MKKRLLQGFTLIELLTAKQQGEQDEGFTLIELLIVIAIIGALAAFIYSFINPTEMTARARDAGRIGGITQLGKAILDYNLNKDIYPAALTWDTDLENIKEVGRFPAGIRYAYTTVSPCATNVKPSVNPTFCYTEDSLNNYGALVFTKLESKKQTSKCTLPEETYVTFSTEDNFTGLICSNGDPAPWAKGTMIYIN